MVTYFYDRWSNDECDKTMSCFRLEIEVKLLINRVASKTEYAKIYDSDQVSMYYQLDGTTFLF